MASLHQQGRPPAPIASATPIGTLRRVRNDETRCTVRCASGNDIKKLDGYILHELISAIYVSAPDKSSGHREQHIRIEYNGIGFIPIHELMAKQTA